MRGWSDHGEAASARKVFDETLGRGYGLDVLEAICNKPNKLVSPSKKQINNQKGKGKGPERVQMHRTCYVSQSITCLQSSHILHKFIMAICKDSNKTRHVPLIPLISLYNL